MVWETDEASGFLERSVPGFGEHRAGLSIPPPEAHRGQARHTRWAGPCPAPLRCDPVLEARYPHFAGNRGTRQAQVTPEVTVTARGDRVETCEESAGPARGRAKKQRANLGAVVLAWEEHGASGTRNSSGNRGGAHRLRARAPLTCACARSRRAKAARAGLAACLGSQRGDGSGRRSGDLIVGLHLSRRHTTRFLKNETGGT